MHQIKTNLARAGAGGPGRKEESQGWVWKRSKKVPTKEECFQTNQPCSQWNPSDGVRVGKKPKTGGRPLKKIYLVPELEVCVRITHKEEPGVNSGGTYIEELKLENKEEEFEVCNKVTNEEELEICMKKRMHGKKYLHFCEQLHCDFVICQDQLGGRLAQVISV